MPVAFEYLITKGHSTFADYKSNTYLLAIRPMISAVASFRKTVAIGLTFKICAGYIIEQNVVFKSKQPAKILLQMQFQRFLVRQQLIQ